MSRRAFAARTDLREFNSASELLAHYSALRARMMRLGIPPKPPAPPPPREPVVWYVPPPFKIHQTPIQRIITAVAKRFKLHPAELRSPRRMTELVEARSIVAYFGRTLLRQSLNQIGRNLGDRDHTTILHGIQKVEHKMIVDPEFGQTIAALREQLMQE
jgi:hypothetical protein